MLRAILPKDQTRVHAAEYEQLHQLQETSWQVGSTSALLISCGRLKLLLASLRRELL